MKLDNREPVDIIVPVYRGWPKPAAVWKAFWVIRSNPGMNWWSSMTPARNRSWPPGWTHWPLTGASPCCAMSLTPAS